MIRLLNPFNFIFMIGISIISLLLLFIFYQKAGEVLNEETERLIEQSLHTLELAFAESLDDLELAVFKLVNDDSLDEALLKNDKDAVSTVMLSIYEQDLETIFDIFFISKGSALQWVDNSSKIVTDKSLLDTIALYPFINDSSPFYFSYENKGNETSYIIFSIPLSSKDTVLYAGIILTGYDFIMTTIENRIEPFCMGMFDSHNHLASIRYVEEKKCNKYIPMLTEMKRWEQQLFNNFAIVRGGLSNQKHFEEFDIGFVIDRKNVSELWETLFYRVLGGLLILVLLNLIIITITYRSIRGAVKNLTTYAESIIQNRRAEHPHSKLYEFNLIASAFSKMVDSFLQESKSRKEAETKLLEQERMATLGQLTSVVAHELRNPLATIRYTTFSIQDQLSDDKGIKLINRIDRNIDRCDNIISELLHYSKVHKGVYALTDLREWLTEIMEELTATSEIKIIVDIHYSCNINIDQERMRRVIVNIFDNACQAMQDQGPVVKTHCLKVSTQLIAEQILIRFNDNGPGIDKKHTDEIFEPLYSTKSYGMGLGLTIVKQIISQHGGEIKIHSTTEGADVVLYLPVKGDK